MRACPTNSGLSPRVRGNPPRALFVRFLSRSIPACTGEPPALSKRFAPLAVYPRVYGGTHLEKAENGLKCGLSPRVRGNLGREANTGTNRRSIPACTGEPGSRSPTPTPGTVYPRVYGGTSAKGEQHWNSKGLSPRVRGNRPSVWGGPAGVRSIPACTGEPGRRAALFTGKGVYPRVYGGTRLPRNPGMCGPGLSPRVRGNRPPKAYSAPGLRSIPACTGEPGRESGLN